MKIVIQLVLAAIICFLGYMVFNSVYKTIEFEEKKGKRIALAVEKLQDIRKAQEAYVQVYGKYTGSFDTLINYIQTGYIPVIKREGVLTDEMLADGISEKEAIKRGLIKVTTQKISVKDSLFKKEGFDPTKLPYLPEIEGKKFFMGADSLETTSGLAVPVFEARVHYNDLFEDLRKGNYEEEYRSDTVELNRLKKYIGLRVGSLEEANNNAGNWE